jgi:glycosyltransferase involved in cell wall biosynthesis
MIRMGLRISVVVPTYNREKDLAHCMEALERQAFTRDGFEVIVVDGGSTDGTLALLDAVKRRGRIRISYFIEPKRGAAAARNAGLREAAGEFIAFTDDDCVPEPGWLSELAQAFPKDAKCAAVGGMVKPLEDGIVPRYLDSCRASRNIDFGENALHLATTNAMYRRSALLDVGGFNERIIIGEDLDLSLRTLRKGYNLRNTDMGLVRHRYVTGIKGLYRKSFLHGTGVATVARIEGKSLDMGWKAFFRSLFFPRSYFDRYGGDRKRGLYDRAAFAILHRIQTIGFHDGYRSESRKSHISSR